MAATEQLCRLLGIDPKCLTPQENLILELDLFTRICEKLKEIYKAKYKDYFSLINISIEKENSMLEAKILRLIIHSILETEEYSLTGIACYTQTTIDVICDIASGKNKAPSLQVARKIIELHRTVRSDLYKEVIKKISAEYLSVA